MTPRTTILAVDDHELVRLGLRSVLAARFGRLQVAEAGTLEEALSFLMTREAEVLVVLLDLNLGDTRGLAGLRLLRERWPRLPVVVVSGTRDERVREEAMLLGARAYVSKGSGDAGLPALVEAVERIARDAESAADGTPAAALRPLAQPGAARLGKRQVQVLELLLAGHDNHAIARETGLALGSVKNCVSAIFLTFNVRSRGELLSLFGN